MPSYKLTYFNMRGRGETPRILFKLAGVEFEDIRVVFPDAWIEFKKTTPFGNLPILEVDGKQLTQSRAIFRYLAREFGYYADNKWDKSNIDCCIDMLDDLHKLANEMFFVQGEELEKMRVEYTRMVLVTMANLEKKLKENNGGDGYFVGNKVEDIVRSKSQTTGRPYKLRRIELKDDNSQVTCKLWGDYAELELEPNTNYTLKCIEVNKSGDSYTTIQSTDLTQIEKVTVTTDEKGTMINIIGINTNQEIKWQEYLSISSMNTNIGSIFLEDGSIEQYQREKTRSWKDACIEHLTWQCTLTHFERHNYLTNQAILIWIGHTVTQHFHQSIIHSCMD